jgi:Ca2+-binding RTX toxin-like protein
VVQGALRLVVATAAVTVSLIAVPNAGAAVTFTVSGTELTVVGDSSANTIDVICDTAATVVDADGSFMPTGLICADTSKITVFGQDGNDDISLQAVTPSEGFTNPVLHGSLIVTGNGGADRLDSSPSLLTFTYGGAGIDRLIGHGANDSMSGGRGADLVRGAGGADFIKGKAGGDDLRGGRGIDFILGGTGRDSISGGASMDCLRGGAGDDLIASGRGRDSVGGGPGDDQIDEGPAPGDVFSEIPCSASAL